MGTWDGAWALQAHGRSMPLPLTSTAYDEKDGQFSPDGQSFAFESNESGTSEIYVQPFPQPGAKVRISTNGGEQVRWRRDGKELYYVALDGMLMAVPVDASAGRSGFGTPVPLFETRPTPTVAIGRQQYVVIDDGERFRTGDSRGGAGAAHHVVVELATAGAAMTMNRRRISPNAAMAAAWLGALAGVVAPRAEAELKVFGNTTTLELAPVLLAAQELGGTVSVGTGGIPDLFDETAADLATNAETQALRQSVDHPDLRLILTVAEGFYRIVARRSAGIAALSDLRGKRIATSPNTSASYYLHKMLGTVGMSSDDITIVPVQPLNLMPRALANREVDAVVIWEPEIQLAAEAIGNDAIEFQDRRVYRELFSLYSTAATLADPAKRREIVAFVRALINATARIGERPSDVWPLVAASTGYDVELIERVWHHEGYPGTLVSDLLDVMVEEDVYVARERNRAPRTRAQLATLIDDSVLRDALMPPLRAQQAPQTHWDQYKNRPAAAQPDQHLTDPALVGAIDLHAHHDPDSYPRNLDAFDVARLAKDRGLRGIVLKNHWTETAGLAYLVRKYATPGFEVFGALTLDLPVGGLNPQAVRYMADVAAATAASSGCRRTTPSTRCSITRRAGLSSACRATVCSCRRCTT